MLKNLKLILKKKRAFKKENEWLTSSISIFSCRQKSFKMILTSQKCIFDKQRLKFKSSKNQYDFKNYFVNESTSASPSTTCKSCGR